MSTFLLILSLLAPSLAQDEAAPPETSPEAAAEPAPAEAAPPQTTRPVGPVPVQMAPMDQPVSPGSLWRDTSGRQLMGLQGNARQVGDLVTVVIREESTSDLGATTSSNKSNQRSGGIGSLFGLESGITGANANMGGEIGFDVNSEATFTGGGATAANVEVATVVTCRVVGVMPNGNLAVEGTKQIRNYREIQYVTVRGMVRPQDIRMDNTVSSQLLADAIIEFHGQGHIAERTRPGIGTRVMDAAWPF